MHVDHSNQYPRGSQIRRAPIHCTSVTERCHSCYNQASVLSREISQPWSRFRLPRAANHRAWLSRPTAARMNGRPEKFADTHQILTGEPDIVICWIDAGAPETN